MDRDDNRTPIGDALPPAKPLTPVQRRRLESAVAIADDPPDGVTYQHTVLCQTCLPYRDPGDSTRVWERRQGAVLLALEAGRVYDRAAQCLVEVGLPYGSRPRLILAHLNREALLHGSPRIEVESSLTAFIRRVVPENSSPRGIEIRRFKDQLSRFAASLVRMVADLPDDRAYQVDTKIIDFMELWGGKDERQRVLWPAVVELSPRYFASLTKHAVPLDERAIGALANSPMALDVYAWLAQRLHRIEPRRPQFITWVSLHLQFGQGFVRLRKFRETFLDVLDTVHTQYRAARVEVDGRGVTLRCSPPPVKGRVAIVAPRKKPVEQVYPASAAIESPIPPDIEVIAARAERMLKLIRQRQPDKAAWDKRLNDDLTRQRREARAAVPKDLADPKASALKQAELACQQLAVVEARCNDWAPHETRQMAREARDLVGALTNWLRITDLT